MNNDLLWLNPAHYLELKGQGLAAAEQIVNADNQVEGGYNVESLTKYINQLDPDSKNRIIRGVLLQELRNKAAMIPDTERWQRLVGLGPEKVGQLQERLDSLASLLTGLQMLVQKLTTAGLDLGELTTAINEYQSLIAERRQQLPQE